MKPNTHSTLSTINEYLKRPYIQRILVLLLAYILLPNYLSSTIYLCEDSANVGIGGCLDHSWQLSIDLAIQKGFIFGEDYIFTYGALGFFSTRSNFSFEPRYFIIFDLFILVNLLYILLYTIRRYTNLGALSLCFLITYTVASGSMYNDQIVFILLLITIFWLNHAIKHSYVWSLIIPVIISTLLFYIKFNASFIGIIIFYGYLGYFFVTDKQNTPQKIIFGLLLPLLIFVLSYPLQTDLIAYARGGFSLVDGYNDAMSLKLGEYQQHFLWAIFMSVLFFILFIRREFKTNIMLFLSGLIFTFVLYKQSFVRSDLHITAFFAIFPGLCGLSLVLLKRVTTSHVLTVTFICVICLTVGLKLGMYPSIKDRLNYITDIISPPPIAERIANNYKNFPLSEEVRSLIGQKTVDIIPWNIDFLYFNGLNYNPRPVVQSYSVYTEHLINVNGKKYNSETAPDFVIFSNQSIDNRYGFFDDEGVKLVLLKDYSCIKFFNEDEKYKFLLFQRTPNSRTINFTESLEKSVKFGEEYNLEDTNKSYFIKFDIDYSLFGKVLRMAYKPPQLLMTFNVEDGSTRTYRVIVPILNSGVIMNPLIEEEKDSYNFFQGLPIPITKKIKSFSIKIDSADGTKQRITSSAYSKEIKFSISEISIIKNN